MDRVAASPREYLVRRPAKNVISPPNPPQKKEHPPKKQQCKNQERLASYKKKLIACGKVQCKRRLDSVATSPREYLVRWPAKNVISPPQNPPQKKTPPQETTMQPSAYKPWSNYVVRYTVSPTNPNVKLDKPTFAIINQLKRSTRWLSGASFRCSFQRRTAVCTQRGEGKHHVATKLFRSRSLIGDRNAVQSKRCPNRQPL